LYKFDVIKDLFSLLVLPLLMFVSSFLRLLQFVLCFFAASIHKALERVVWSSYCKSKSKLGENKTGITILIRCETLCVQQVLRCVAHFFVFGLELGNGKTFTLVGLERYIGGGKISIDIVKLNSTRVG